jgi:hypothetical protein
VPRKSKRKTSVRPAKKHERKLAAPDEAADAIRHNFPAGVAQPALRALAGAGYASLDQLAKVKKEDLSKLHGMGPKAIGLIEQALAARGKSFRP